MMTPSLHPALFRHLCRLQRSTYPPESSFRRLQHLVGRTSWYRFQRALGAALLVVPSITVERCGMLHLHGFVTSPGEQWLSLPYAVEACWVTRDLCAEVLYLHCVVPIAHRDHVLSLLHTYPCAHYDVLWSSTGWQQFLTPDEPIDIPLPEEPDMAPVVRACPLILPVVMESWRYPNSLPLIWERLRTTLGRRIPAFLPRTRIHYVNGRLHVGAAFQRLRQEGLVRQHVIRYHPLLAASIEVFLALRATPDELRAIIEALRTSLHAVESYPTSDGYFVRLLGPHRLIDAVMGLADVVRQRVRLVFFHMKRYPVPTVRFAYETLFDPVRQWEVTP